MKAKYTKEFQYFLDFQVATDSCKSQKDRGYGNNLKNLHRTS